MTRMTEEENLDARLRLLEQAREADGRLACLDDAIGEIRRRRPT